jgi:ergothioneine biosynthesis protein EgtB
MLSAFAGGDDKAYARAAPVIELGLHHEQQHQELLLTDIKHVFSINPMRPAYRKVRHKKSARAPALAWVAFHEGLHWIGHDGNAFAYDNETPKHRVFLRSFALSSRSVTNGEYLTFMEDGGYDSPELWLSDGWDRACAERWRAPLYWEKKDSTWWCFTLSGMRPVDMQEPVSHVSFYEADAYARWAGARLPTEAEWETAALASGQGVRGRFVEDGRFHPSVADGAEKDGPLCQMFGDVWEWTASPYTGYPGYRPPEGVLGEYNGKFMSNQMVLRGGSCATSKSHIRPTYRNFFAPGCRWQFMGFRLAREV